MRRTTRGVTLAGSLVILGLTIGSCTREPAAKSTGAQRYQSRPHGAHTMRYARPDGFVNIGILYSAKEAQIVIPALGRKGVKAYAEGSVVYDLFVRPADADRAIKLVEADPKIARHVHPDAGGPR